MQKTRLHYLFFFLILYILKKKFEFVRITLSILELELKA